MKESGLWNSKHNGMAAIKSAGYFWKCSNFKYFCLKGTVDWKQTIKSAHFITAYYKTVKCQNSTYWVYIDWYGLLPTHVILKLRANFVINSYPSPAVANHVFPYIIYICHAAQAQS